MDIRKERSTFEEIYGRPLSEEDFLRIQSMSGRLRGVGGQEDYLKKIRELLSKREGTDPNLMQNGMPKAVPTGLLAAANMFADDLPKGVLEVAGKSVEDMKTERDVQQENIENDALAAKLNEMATGSNIDAIRALLLQPAVKETGSYVEATPKPVKPVKPDKNAERARIQKEIAKGKIRKLVPFLSKKNIPGVGELEGGMYTGVAALTHKKKEDKKAVNIVRNQIANLGYATARANDPDSKLSDKDVGVAAAQYGVGEGEQEDRIIQGVQDMLSDMIKTYPDDPELVELLEQVNLQEEERTKKFSKKGKVKEVSTKRKEIQERMKKLEEEISQLERGKK